MKKFITILAVAAAAAMTLSCVEDDGSDEDSSSAQYQMLGWWQGTTEDLVYWLSYEYYAAGKDPSLSFTQAYKYFGDASNGITDTGNEYYKHIVKEGGSYVIYNYYNEGDYSYYFSKITPEIEGDTFVYESSYPADGTTVVTSLVSSSRIDEFSSVMWEYEGTPFFYTSNVHFKNASKPSWADEAKER